MKKRKNYVGIKAVNSALLVRCFFTADRRLATEWLNRQPEGSLLLTIPKKVSRL